MSTVKKIPVNSAKISGTHSNMPLYIKPSAMSGWGSVTLAEAQSMRFYSDAGLTTELAREIVSADEIHVKVSSVTTTTEIWCSYDGVASDYGVATSFGRNAVWGASFKAVYHMDDVTTSTIADSTGNGNSGTKTGANAPQEINGLIGKAQEFDASANAGNGEEINLGTGVYTIGTGDFTFYARVKLNSLANTQGIIYNKRAVGGNNRTLLWPRLDGSDLKFQHWATDTVNATFFHPTVLAIDTWYSVYMTRTGSSGALIVNNSKQTGTTRGGDLGGATTWHIGNALSAASWFPLDGILDEVRVLDAVVSDDWATTEYNNQNDVATFWGTVTDAGGAPVANNGFMVFF